MKQIDRLDDMYFFCSNELCDYTGQAVLCPTCRDMCEELGIISTTSTQDAYTVKQGPSAASIAAILAYAKNSS